MSVCAHPGLLVVAVEQGNPAIEIEGDHERRLESLTMQLK
jgi:hypothetical protein